MKNGREWVYPDSERLHQLLFKAAWLQEQEPDVPLVPLLVCRRAAYRTFPMAKAFGFYVADARAQFVPRREDVTPADVDELREGLGLSDLVHDVGRNRLLVKHFGVALPRVAGSASNVWRTTGAGWIEHFRELRRQDLPRDDRKALARDLEDAIREALAAATGGTIEIEPEYDRDLDWDTAPPDWGYPDGG